MKKNISARGSIGITATALVVVLVISYFHDQAKALPCDATILDWCVDAIVKESKNPSKKCCQMLSFQFYPCFCTFLGDPRYGKYLRMAGAKVVVEACGLTWAPSCSGWKLFDCRNRSRDIFNINCCPSKNIIFTINIPSSFVIATPI